VTSPAAPSEPHPPIPGHPRLSVVVPAFGEERRIAGTIARLRDTLTDVVGEGGLEIVVVDDGSVDGTATAAEAAGADRVIRLPVNRGKGAAVRAGALAATGSAVAFTDADLAYAPTQIARLLDEIEKGWDVVVGNRHEVDASGHVGLRTIGHRVFNAATRLVLARRFADTQCGCKGFHGAAARRIFTRARIDRFAFDVEVLWLAGELGLTIEEVGVELDGREGSTVRFSVDALRMLRDLGRIRWWILRGAYRRSE
jgi:glycosyltransferase involved in cell wall biosynthesis